MMIDIDQLNMPLAADDTGAIKIALIPSSMSAQASVDTISQAPRSY